MASMRVAAVLATVQMVSSARVKVHQFQKLFEGEVDRLNLAHHLPLCAEEIVTETCQETFGKESSEGLVAPSEMQEMLSATPDAIAALWSELSFTAGEATPCSTLCQQSVEALRRMSALPPASDVGCYLVGRGKRHSTRCDVDVRPDTIKKQTKHDGDLPNFHDSDKQDVLAQAANETGALVEAARPRHTDSIDYPVKVAIRRTANLFRIFPATLTTVNEEADEEEVTDIEGETPPVELEGQSMLEMLSQPALAASGGVGCASFCTVASYCTKYPYSCGSCSFCTTAPAPAPPVSCSSWCSSYDDCKFSSCSGCSVCSAPAPTPAPVSCSSWCSSYDHCKYSSCSGCSVCSGPAPTPAPAPAPASGGSPCELSLETVMLTSGDSGISVHVSCSASVQEPEMKFTGGSTNYAPKYFQDIDAGSYTLITVSQAALNCYTVSFSGRSGGSSFTVSEKAPCGGVVPAPSPVPSPVPSPAPSSGGGEAWRQTIQVANAKAIAYVQTALRKFKARNTQAAITKWYGPNAYTDTALRRRLLAILNGVDAMLGNVEYAMGPKCSPNTYAYVYPQAYTCASSDVGHRACTKNKNGQFIFYICDLTLRKGIGEQIETMTHEGSHHETARTDDVDFEGGTAYGRYACQRLAKANPSKAMENADNFCYYVQDVTDGV